MKCDIASHCQLALLLRLWSKVLDFGLLVISAFLSIAVLNCTCLGNALLLYFSHLPITLLMYNHYKFKYPRKFVEWSDWRNCSCAGSGREQYFQIASFYSASVLCSATLGYFPFPCCIFMQMLICFDRTWIDDFFFPAKQIFNERIYMQY